MSFESLSMLKKDEVRTIGKSKNDFKKELRFVNEASEVLLRTFEILSNRVLVREFTNSEDATYRVAYRILRTLHCAFNSSLEGYYDVSMALLRMAYENHLLMKYLSESEKEAKLWVEGKKFSPSFLRKHVSYASNSMYQMMSDFIHSNFKGTLAFTIVEDGRMKATMGEYDKKQLESVLLLTLLTIEATAIWLSIKFAQELMENEEWHSMFKETVPKIWKYLNEELHKHKKNLADSNPFS